MRLPAPSMESVIHTSIKHTMRQPANHARICLQQRGIPPAALEDLLDYGRCCHDHHGATIVYFDHQARNTLRRRTDATAFRRIERYLDTYAVVAPDGDIVTVGHRTRPIGR
jgi:hypothetical protein